jgi:hypothetical protein
MCEKVDATHCECLLDDMMCNNLMCLNKAKFCDGVNDCGDESDEPANCENDCSIALEVYDDSKICDAKIDCKGEHDLGKDESVERCCTADSTVNNYRCVLGNPLPGYIGNVTISDTCIPKKCVCDWDANDPSECPRCPAGEDENDCMSIFSVHSYSYGKTELKPGLPSSDAFGRSETHSDGYVYFTAHGKNYLYCASKKIFTDERKVFIGEALCKHENFVGLKKITLHAPFSRTRINPSYVLPTLEKKEYDECEIVFLSCRTNNYN